jgi:hypothetical protein
MTEGYYGTKKEKREDGTAMKGDNSMTQPSKSRRVSTHVTVTGWARIKWLSLGFNDELLWNDSNFRSERNKGTSWPDEPLSTFKGRVSYSAVQPAHICLGLSYDQQVTNLRVRERMYTSDGGSSRPPVLPSSEQQILVEGVGVRPSKGADSVNPRWAK